MKALPSYPNPLLRRSVWPGDVPAPSLYYRAMRRFFQVSVCAIWKVRVFNRHYEPREGSAVYICNHQSFLDPILMSFALRRPMHYMARDSLFGWGPFARLIRSLNAFPVRRGTADTAAIKESMRRLRCGGQVVVFPEGTRTLDGRIQPFLPGVAVLSQRAARWTVPVLIDGAFEAWPRSARLPRPGSIVVQYAAPISQDQAREMAAEELVGAIRTRLVEMQTALHKRLGKRQSQ